MDGMRKSMDRLRRSLRQSFRRSKKSPSTSTSLQDTTQPPQWQNDETAVRAGNCSFQVKYLGCVEVFESRGMQICEEALKQLRHSTRKSQRAVLHISGDGLRVVDATSSQLIVDQTIEKVSFCAPDRNHDRGFSYICRDGATRRWLCHGFIAVRESGERLSHAVGCSFQICLEKKQKRDREVASSQPLPQSMSHTEMASVHTPSTFVTQTPSRSASSLPLTRSASTTPASTFVRQSSTRTSTIIERMKDPQEGRQASPPPLPTGNVVNPHMRDRPHVTPQMLERQQSLRVFSTLNSATPFKRNTSLQSRDVPTTLASQRKPTSFDVPSVTPRTREINNNVPTWEDGTPILDEFDGPLAEEPEEMTEEVSRLCQQMSFDLGSMSASHLNSSTRHEYIKLSNGGTSTVNGAGDQSFDAAAAYPLPKSTTVQFPVVREHETAQEARMRFAERSPFTRTVHPPVDGVMTNGYTNHSTSVTQNGLQNGHSTVMQNGGAQKQQVNGIDWNDPFNADWVQVQKNDGASTNPFLT